LRNGNNSEKCDLYNLLCVLEIIIKVILVYKEEVVMNYSEEVAERVDNKDCKEVWNEISAAYDQDGEEGVKSVLIGKAEDIEREYQEVCEQLKQKL